VALSRLRGQRRQGVVRFGVPVPRGKDTAVRRVNSGRDDVRSGFKGGQRFSGGGGIIKYQRGSGVNANHFGKRREASQQRGTVGDQVGDDKRQACQYQGSAGSG
jgi:hypothetical protein